MRTASDREPAGLLAVFILDSKDNSFREFGAWHALLNFDPSHVADLKMGPVGKTTVAGSHIRRVTVEQIAEMDVTHVVIATGSFWRRDGVGRHNHQPIPIADAPAAYTPEDILAEKPIDGPVIVFDDDRYYMGGAIAERLRRKGLEVALVTPAALVSEWTVFTLEQERIQANLIELGVEILANAAVTAMQGRDVEIVCRFTGRRHRREAQSLVLVTARLPNDSLFDDLSALLAKQRHSAISSVRRIGDCLAPGTIGEAVFGGHRCARELDQPPGTETFIDETVVGDTMGSH